MSKASPLSGIAAGGSKHVPLAILLDPYEAELAAGYAQSIVAKLQELHTGSQIMVTVMLPQPGRLTVPPLVPPNEFFSNLLPHTLATAAAVRSAAGWRSRRSILRGIEAARNALNDEKFLGTTISPGGPATPAPPPRYVLCVTGRDLDDDLDGWDPVESLEDDGDSEQVDQAALVALFGRPPKHGQASTLFSLVCLSYTPLLEEFWKQANTTVSQSVVATSLSPTIPPSLQLASPSHAFFLTGFSSPQRPPPPQHQRSASNVPSTLKPAPEKRAADGPPPASKRGKTEKQKPSPVPGLPRSLNPGTTSPAQFATASLNQAPLTNANLHAYLQAGQSLDGVPKNAPPMPNNMAMDTTGASQSFVDFQNALNPPLQRPPMPPQQNSQSRSTQPPQPGLSQKLTEQQKALLPQLAPPIRAQFQQALNNIKERRERNEISQEEAALQVSKLQDTATSLRLQMLQKQAADSKMSTSPDLSGMQQQQSSGKQTPRQSSQSSLPQMPHQQGQSGPTQQQFQESMVAYTRMQQQAQSQAQAAQSGRISQQQPPVMQQLPAPQQAPLSSNQSTQQSAIWKGVLIASIPDNTNTGQKRDISIHCYIVPMHAAASAALSGVQIPPQIPLTNLLSLKMDEVQKLSTSLPPVSIMPVPTSQLPDHIKAEMAPDRGNEGRCMLLQKLLETRKECGVVRFSPSTTHGMLIVPNKTSLAGIIFHKIALPDSWSQSNQVTASAAAASIPQFLPQSTMQQMQGLQQQLQQTPAQTQQALLQQYLSASNQQAPGLAMQQQTMPFLNPPPPQMTGRQYLPNPQMPGLPAPPPQQQQPPQRFPALGGMSMDELSEFLSPQELAKLSQSFPSQQSQR